LPDFSPGGWQSENHPGRLEGPDPAMTGPWRVIPDTAPFAMPKFLQKEPGLP